MSLCYLYSQTSTYSHRNKLLNSFVDSMSLNINDMDSIKDFDIYIVELNNADKEISLKLKNMFQEKNHPLIYFIIPKNYTLLLFQLTFLLETKAIVTHNQNIDKLIIKIKLDQESNTQYKLEKWLGNIKLTTQKFLLYKDKKLIFTTQNVLDMFECHNSDSFSTQILTQIDLHKLLDKNFTLTEPIKIKSEIYKEYTFKSLSVSDTEKLIYIDDATSVIQKPNFISSRFALIEIIKEKILQKDDLDFQLSLMSINIANIKTLIIEFGIVEFENILLNLLSFMESMLEEKLIFSQFENNFYVVLFENRSFEETNTLAKHFHTMILQHITTNKLKVALDLYSLNLSDLEFSEILTTLNSIENENFTLNEKKTPYIKHLSSKVTKVNAKNLLDDAYHTKLKFKILNIYHGLVINTSSKILKITDENIYITFEALQGIVLNNEMTTVLQSEQFFQDIYAEVIQINLSKKVAVLANFKFLKTNANARQHARVSTSIKIPIVLKIDGKIFNGTILDISIKSIAMKIKHIPKIGTPEQKLSTLTFNIKDKTSEHGYVQLNLQAKVIVITPIDTDGYYKVVCNLLQDSHDLDIVLKYVYERQKELIIELKKMSKLN